MDNLFEQMANISKANAYDIVSKQRDELVAENKKMREMLFEAATWVTPHNEESAAIMTKITNYLYKK